jgi:hypothetical protein
MLEFSKRPRAQSNDRDQTRIASNPSGHQESGVSRHDDKQGQHEAASIAQVVRPDTGSFADRMAINHQAP